MAGFFGGVDHPGTFEVVMKDARADRGSHHPGGQRASNQNEALTDEEPSAEARPLRWGTDQRGRCHSALPIRYPTPRTVRM
ncbi:Uncharacterised protein [Mycobacteroides abscessus subsp. abscessus]|nr:Uncharacterised protein [Mycobacteroides abscessus subsp. abscessus]